jgi:hypothetical protein
MTHRKWYPLLAGAALLAAACSEPSTGTSGASSLAGTALSAAFSSTPVGYGDLSSSFVGSTAAAFSDASLWLGGGRGASLGSGALMGGGLGDAFVGGVAFGHGGRGGPFFGGLACTGTFNATTGRVECAAETRNGITVTRSAAYTTAAGAVQQAFDTLTTNSVNLQTAASGTVSYDRAADTVGDGGRHGGWGHGRGDVGRLLGDTSTILTATTTVQSASSRTVSGLASGSTQRTVNGASKGTESTTGTSSRGAFTASRTFGDTTSGVVVPVRTASDTTKSYPTAGTVVRVVNATLTYTGQSPVTLSRREVVTYNGTSTATVTITENGTTKTCTRTLPRGALTCS